MNGGCTDGSECTGGVCIYTGFSTLSWTVTNGIPETLLYRFFDENRNLVWPNANQAYTLAPNASETKGLRCNIGDNICFGARNAAMTRYWGVDLDRSKPCANCCFICATRSVSLPRITY